MTYLPRILLVAALVAFSSIASQAQSDATTFILVRHAEKQSGQDPSLTEAGVARAEALRDSLDGIEIDALIASQFKRTSETLGPLAAERSMDVQVRALDVRDVAGSAAEVALALVDEYDGRTVVVAGHSNTIPIMAGALAGIGLTELDERDYDNIFVVKIKPDGTAWLNKKQYGEPDVVD